MFSAFQSGIPAHWTKYFFYPVTPIHCSFCAYPLDSGQACPACRCRHVVYPPSSATFLSYTWGRSHSPAYAFKTRTNFEEDLRRAIVAAFNQLANAVFDAGNELDYIVPVPPNKSFQWGQQYHLNDLIVGLESVLRPPALWRAVALQRKPGKAGDVGIWEKDDADKLRGARVLLVDNTWVSGATILGVAAKLAELGAKEVHLLLMSRWLNESRDFNAIKMVQQYRKDICPDARFVLNSYKAKS